MMMEAFDLADYYRNPVMLVGDGLIGQMMEPVEFPENYQPKISDKTDWATDGCKGRDPHLVKTLFLDQNLCDQHNQHLTKKYQKITNDLQRWEEYNLDDNYDVLLVSYGTMSRICKTAIDELKAEGVNVGLIRPQSLYPYPYDAVLKAADKPSVKAVMSIEMSMGQMVEDVRLAVNGKKPVEFYGRAGGVIPKIEEVMEAVKNIL